MNNVQQCNNPYSQMNYVYKNVKIYKTKLTTCNNVIIYKAKWIRLKQWNNCIKQNKLRATV